MGALAIAGKRASLRAIGDDDLAAIEVWYAEAATTAYDALRLEERRRQAESRDGLMAIARPDETEPIGLIQYQTSDSQDGWLTVPFIALAKAYRGWGYGSEAVRLLEEWAVREGLAKRFRAEVDARNGLGLYFWLRLGYRPAGWHAEGGRDSMTMIRES